MKYFKLVPAIKGFQSSQHLNMLRGLSALEVCAGHLRNLFFVDYLEVDSKNFLIKILYYITGFGHQAVVLFFVLSGFFISSSVIKSQNDNKWSWSYYLINRLSRLYIVLIPALLIGGLWDYLGINIFGKNTIYGGQAFGANIGGGSNISDQLNLLTFLGNLTFLQNIKVPTFGSNSALWSLNYEFWYYLLFPLILLMLAKYTPFKVRLIYTLLTISIFILVGQSIIIYFLIWLMGTLISVSGYFVINQHKKIFYYLYLAVSLALFVGSLAISRVGLISSSLISDFVIGISSTVFIYTLLQDKSPSQSGIYNTLVDKLSGFSYTLYLVHLPLLVFCQAWFIHNQRWQPNMMYLGAGIIMLAIIILYAFLISSVTEAKTEDMRKYLTFWLVKKLN